MKKLPTLTTAGWLEDVSSVATTLMDYFLTSEHSQSNFYPKHISSLPYLVQQFGSNPTQLADAVQSKLRILYSRYMDEVTVRVSNTAADSETGQYNLNIDIIMSKDGKRSSLGRSVAISESKVMNVSITS